MADLTINFGWTSDAQSVSATQREIQASTNTFARVIVDNVAYNIAVYSSQQAHRTLAASVRRAVDDEMRTMAMTIGHSIRVAESRTGASGTMSATGVMSQTARGQGWRNSLYNWNRKATGIKWDKRNPKYVDRKADMGWPRDWWEAGGSLAEYLSQPQTYTQAFGPVRVIFDRPKNQARARSKLGSSPRITASGITGPIVAEYEVGKIRVIAMGNITPADLPSLRSGNVNNAKPSMGAGLARHLRNENEKVKLLRGAHKTKNQRYVLEPFISFFMTRAIPNAVWRRIEQTPLATEKAGRSR